MTLPAGSARTPPAPVLDAAQPDPPGPGRAGFVATLAVLAVVGGELGLLGAFLALSAPRVLGVAVPLGPLVGVVGNLLVGRWVIRSTGLRAAVLAPALGWLAAVLPMSASRPEGDLVITNDPKGMAFILLGALAWAVVPALVRPAALKPAPPAADEDSSGSLDTRRS